MKLLRTIFVLFALGLVRDTTAQTRPPGQQSSLNLVDDEGKKHGTWVVRHEGKMGEAPYSEWGSYDHGRKTGLWYKMDATGTLAAIERFRNNTLDGEVKYYEEGRLAAIGHYKSLNQSGATDTIMVENPVTGEQSLVALSSERGSLKHGSWKFYDAESGRLIREEEYQVDNLISSREFTMTHKDSLYYYNRAARLPHNTKGAPAKPPAGKNVSYLNK